MMLSIRDWGEVEKRLIESTRAETKTTAYAKSALFSELLRSNNSLLWHTMIAESSYPFVAIAGFHCICQKQPKESWVTGLRILAQAKIPASPVYDPIYEKLSQDKPKQIDPSALVSILSQRGNTSEGLTVVMALVPKMVIVGWLRSERVRGASALPVTAALSRVLGDEEKELLTEEETETLLKDLAPCPGLPKLLYATYTRTHDKNYLRVLRSVLADDQFPDLLIAVLIEHQKKPIREHFDELRGELPEKRVRLLEETLKCSRDGQ